MDSLRRMTKVRVLLPLLLLASYACGDDDVQPYQPSNTPDATLVDAGASDTGAADSGLTDAGTADSASTADAADGGTNDAATSSCTPANTFQVTNVGASSYSFTRNGASLGSNPALTLQSGTTYCFDVAAQGHPFYLKTARTTGGGDGVPSVTANGAEVGRVQYTANINDGASLFYICAFHSAMSGTITISN